VPRWSSRIPAGRPKSVRYLRDVSLPAAWGLAPACNLIPDRSQSLILKRAEMSECFKEHAWNANRATDIKPLRRAEPVAPCSSAFVPHALDR